MCRLALGVFPSNTPHDELHIRQVRHILVRTLNFGEVIGIPLFIHHADASWDSFLDFKKLHPDSAEQMKRIHTGGHQIILGDEKYHHVVRTHLNMSDSIE